MKLSQWVRVSVLLLAITMPASAKPEPSHPGHDGSHHAALAEHLARTEAHVRALGRHLSAAAEKSVHRVKDVRILEGIRKIDHRHLHEPLLWNEYVRHLPGWVVAGRPEVFVGPGYEPKVVEVEAENAAAAFGDDLDALWARRKQVQSERLVLWAKIAFRSVAEMELADQPLYRFDLTAGKTPLDQQRLETLQAAVQFVRLADHLAAEAQDAVDVSPPDVFVQWHKIVSAARKQMQDKILMQPLTSLDAYKPETDAGKLSFGARQLADLAQTIVDSERALAAADAAYDDDEADASRQQLQQALSDTVGAVAALDQAVNNAATAWAIAGIPGTKAPVVGLVDLMSPATPAAHPVDAAVAASPGRQPPAADAPPIATPGSQTRTALIGREHSAEFEDAAPQGAVLVGFELTTARKHGAAIINSARPVYRNAAGEVPGKQLGSPSGAVTRVVARPGYGVVAIDIHCGARHMQGMVLHFMRINGSVAVPTDAYDSPTFGYMSDSTKIGDNRPVIGVFGEAGANIDKLGLVQRN